MTLYHGSGEIVEYPEIKITKYTKDFSWGFYLTSNKNQAEKWAKKRRKNGTPTVNHFNYIPDESLKILKFDEMTNEWLEFVAKCRAGIAHEYDIVEGPMADDTVWNYVKDFLNDKLPKQVFRAYAEFRYPTHQISFHTLKALQCLKFEKSEALQ